MELAQQIQNATTGAGARGDGSGACVTLGTFDGVHRGHQALLRSVKQHANARQLEPVALVFRKPPRSVINPGLRTPLLCTLEERISLIRAEGISRVMPIEFDRDIRGTSAVDFIGELRDSLDTRCLMLGERARVGHDQLTVPELASVAGGDVHPIECVSIPMAKSGDATYSSSGVRNALAEGDVQAAFNMLGRAFHRGGDVVKGQGRATDLGIPTANISWTPDIAMPAPGIYASWTTIGAGVVHPSATYIGDNPTLGGAAGAFETHLLDYDGGSLYGETVSVSFVERIRGDAEFASVADLTAQLGRDIDQISDILRGREPVGYPIR